MDKASTTVNSDNVKNEEDYDSSVPLQHQRAFGAGLFKKPVSFVPAAEQATVQAANSKRESTAGTAEWYLSMVLPNEDISSLTSSPKKTAPGMEMCAVCNTEYDPANRVAHEGLLIHQARLPHSHPPSAIDRSRKGLSILENHGWDADSRKGLGASQQGTPFPIKPKAKDDTRGVGMPPARADPRAKITKRTPKQQATDEKIKTARIRNELWGNDKIEKYLYSGGK